ncbi:MAG: PD-(D/E)XK nuclease family protein [Halioglobus sp.]|nr:PD-(D/E)XK nuclease family protein [Halioglobus sp.]
MPRSLYDITPLVPLVEAGYVLLTPNLRLARRIKSEWDARRIASGATAWEPIPVQPLESWLAQQWQRAVALGLVAPLVPINSALAGEIWQQVVAQEESESNQYHLLRPAAAAELAAQARETLLRWQVDTSRQNLRQEFTLDRDCGTFLRWLDLFEQRLAAAGQGTALDCVRALQSCAPQMPRSRVALVEFDDIPPLYQAVVTALSDQSQVIEPAGEPGERYLYAFPDKRAELQAVARWAATTSRENPASSVGIVLSDMAAERVALEHLLRREFDCLGENYTSLPVNFSTGISLDRAPVVRDALAALALAGPRTTVAAVTALLQSRFLNLPDALTALAGRFQTRLFDAGREELNTADLRHLASEVRHGESKGLLLGQYLLAISGMRELRQSALPSAWVERFCEVLGVWGWPGPGPLDSLEFQQVELWYRTLDEFRGYDAVCNPLSFSQALQLFRSSCARQMSQPRTADAKVQVLGPLEAAGLAFDHLWVCGMQATRWPAPASPNPFIPQGLQRRLQMPHATAQREWMFAQGLLRQYERSTPMLHASYCRQMDDAPEMPSALLEGFTPAEPPVAVGIDPDWLRLWQQRQPLLLDDSSAPPPGAAELEAISGGSGLLEDQSQCPFRAFARRRLGVEPLPDFTIGLSASERGSLLHDALKILWGEIRDQASLLALGASAEAEMIAGAVRGAIEIIPGARRQLLGRAYWQLESRRLERLLREWLAVERQRGEFVVSERESDISLRMGALQLRLRVDRIDRLPDGSLMVIDYKSGVSRVQDWLGERPAKPQLLLYGSAAAEPPAALAFAQVRHRDSRFVGLGRTEAAPGVGTDIGKAVKGRMDATDWESLNEHWRRNLQRLALEFVSGQARVDPLTPASCTWCGLQALCRVGIDGMNSPQETAEIADGDEEYAS